ncbi:Gfo/Idh/MocA family oxidoreductase [Paenibacillus sp. GYB004]|uniref:Gfo/Idh/MocA family oxidoreductase n=1 Tax=Paenibacillus sp. GYB004 TaxID=2994393 RepID=UPI002F967715
MSDGYTEGSGIMLNRELRLAMLGMVEGNGHPYSWSAIVNGYREEEMKTCPYPAIFPYLSRQPAEQFGIPGARVTHIWTDRPEEGEQVARASRIGQVVARPEDVIGHVDAVLITTDIGSEHVERCRPFVEAGLPVFVDKPLTDNEADLRQFCRWVEEGKAILSSSSSRYSKEFLPYRLSTHSLGQLRFVSATMLKSWERYGIHSLEAVYTIVGPGFLSVRHSGTKERSIVHLKHHSGVDIVVAVIEDLYGSYGILQLCGTDDYAVVRTRDTFYSFKAQLQSFVGYVRTGERPYPFTETVELCKLIIAGIRSREQGGREVFLDELEL